MRADIAERRLRDILTESADESGLDRVAIEAIVDNAQIAHFDPGATITRASKTAGLSQLVLSGVVRMMFQGERSDPMIVRFIRPGQSLTSIYERGTRPAFGAVAHTHTGIAFVAHEVFINAVGGLDEKNRSRFARHSWTIMSDLLREKCELLTADVRHRLLREFATLAENFGEAHPRGTLINLQLKQDDLAQLVVVDRSTVNRKLRELETEGLVTRSGGRYLLAHSVTTGPVPSPEKLIRPAPATSRAPSPGRLDH